MKKELLLILVLMTSLLSCEREDIDPDQNTRDNPQNVDLVHKKQRTIRYDCNENIKSDQLETLNFQLKRFQVEPKLKKNVYSFYASNGNAERGILVDKTGIFTLTLYPTIINLRAYPGLNTINYNFKYCDRITEEEVTGNNGRTRTRKTCAYEPIIKESGALYIYITETDEVVPGIREIKESSRACS